MTTGTARSTVRPGPPGRASAPALVSRLLRPCDPCRPLSMARSPCRRPRNLRFLGDLVYVCDASVTLRESLSYWYPQRSARRQEWTVSSSAMPSPTSRSSTVATVATTVDPEATRTRLPCLPGLLDASISRPGCCRPPHGRPAVVAVCPAVGDRGEELPHRPSHARLPRRAAGRRSGRGPEREAQGEPYLLLAQEARGPDPLRGRNDPLLQRLRVNQQVSGK